MIRRVRRAIITLVVLGLVGLIAWQLDLLAWVPLPYVVRETVLPRVMTEAQYERWARQQFYQQFPGQKPLNWRIADWARRYYETKPMGKFVLHDNDCSDFVDCLVDDALGAKARFRRDSDQHIVMRMPRIMRSFYWQSGLPVMPGDIVTVTHSPWYPPKEPSPIRHIGVVGPDGCVYDFVKLRSWRTARYGRERFEWFIRHSWNSGEVIITRLRPEYRFRINPLPLPD